MAKIKERWYQKDAVDAFAQFVSTHPAGHNPLIVMPTGTGKSVVIASIIKWARQWQENKVLVLTHVSELVKQNGLKLAAVYPEAVIGYCSAGLGLRDTKHNIIFGTVQTVYSILKRNKHAFGERCLVIIDECHLLSEKSSSQYRTVLRTLSEICPAMRVCGLSATPYRAKGILLTEQKDPIFTDVAYDLTSHFTKLIEEGYLAPLVTLKTPVSINLEGVHIRGGEFKDDELQKAVGNEQLLSEACNIMVREGRERKAWLVFVSGIKNTETVKRMLETRGVVVRSVNSSHEQSENDTAIADFRAGRVRCLVSANQLTTGFDVPQVDMIGMLRPTMSVSLHVQSLGRGTRPAVGKTDCLVLDFARNVERLGPINAPVLKGPSAPRDVQLMQDRPKTKFCDRCGSEIPISSRSCPICGYQPPQDLDLEDLASVDVIAYSQHLPHVKGASVANVVSMISSAHRSVKGADCVRVYLGCRQGQKSFKAWLYLCFDAGSRSLAKQAAADMWRKLRGLEPVPKNTMAALQRVHELKQPKEVELLRANLKRHYDVLVTAYY